MRCGHESFRLPPIWPSLGVSYFLPADAGAVLWLYHIKTVVVLGLLVYFWSSYQEWQRPIFTDAKDVGLGIAWVCGECVVGQARLVLSHARRSDRVKPF